ncbi:MAG: hypothetical protein IPK69_01375 [Phycisphaerales bacterium]|nr:MAG: hypothetical protein IPK69_01375 [Phycisphaerales bacterium]
MSKKHLYDSLCACRRDTERNGVLSNHDSINRFEMLMIPLTGANKPQSVNTLHDAPLMPLLEPEVLVLSKVRLDTIVSVDSVVRLWSHGAIDEPQLPAGKFRITEFHRSG